MSRGDDVADETFNYVMFSDEPISIQERGFADPALLGAQATAVATALVVNDFANRRSEKRGYWEARRQDLMRTVAALNNFAGIALDAIELPMKGYHALTALGGDLAAGRDFNDALMRAAQVAQQDIDTTSQELADATFEATGSPAAATAARVGTLIADPF